MGRGEKAKLADFAASLASCEERVTQFGYGGFGPYGGSRLGYSGFGPYGFGNRGFYGRPVYRHGNFDRTRSGGRASDFGSAINRAVRDVSSRSTNATAPRSVPSRPSASRSSVSRSSAAPRRTARPVTRSAPRSVRNSGLRRGNVKLEFQNADLANQAAGVSEQGVSSPLRLAAVSPFRRGYNYGFYNRGGFGYGPGSVVVTPSCGRVERLRVFVPQERLETAERYGLTVFARSETGDEQAITLPPNYVMAYQMVTKGGAPAAP